MSGTRKAIAFGMSVVATVCIAAEPVDVLAKLRAAGELRCQPSHPVFCANVHVTCVGPTRTPTFAFHLRAAGSSGSIKVIGDAGLLDGLYDRANATWDTTTQSLILQPQGTQGYMRLQSDGRYSFRYYVGAVGTMSLGQCE